MYDKKKQTNANKVLNYTCMVHVYLECLAEHLFNSRRHRRTPSPLPPLGGVNKKRDSFKPQQWQQIHANSCLFSDPACRVPHHLAFWKECLKPFSTLQKRNANYLKLLK